MSFVYTGLASTRRREAEGARAEHVLMCRALAVIFLSGVAFIAMWAALLDKFDVVTYLMGLTCLLVGSGALLLTNYDIPKRAFTPPLLLGVAMQVALVGHFDQIAGGFFLLLPAMYCVIFFWDDKPVLITGTVLATAAFVAEPLIVGGTTSLRASSRRRRSSSGSSSPRAISATSRR